MDLDRGMKGAPSKVQHGALDQRYRTASGSDRIALSNLRSNCWIRSLLLAVL